MSVSKYGRVFVINSSDIYRIHKDWIFAHGMGIAWNKLYNSYESVMIDGRGPFPLEKRPFNLLFDESGEAIAFKFGGWYGDSSELEEDIPFERSEDEPF